LLRGRRASFLGLSLAAMAERRVVAAINPRSGGNKGQAVLAQLTALIGAEQVFDLTTEMRGPGALAAQLQQWAADARPSGKRPALLVCGGDGTVSWLLTALVEGGLIDAFSVATIPLGTANDFARVMGWSNAYFSGIAQDAADRLGGRRDELLAQRFDVWSVSQFRGGPALTTPASFEAHGQALRTLPIINYFSIGYDAKVAFEFNEMRNRHPGVLKSRLCNMAAYGCLGLSNAALCCCTATPPHLNGLGVTVTVDGKDVPVPCGVQGLTAINVPSYANGTQPWGRPGACSASGRGFEAGTVDDGRIEVFAGPRRPPPSTNRREKPDPAFLSTCNCRDCTKPSFHQDKHLGLNRSSLLSSLLFCAVAFPERCALTD